jgi:hypothetical protein
LFPLILRIHGMTSNFEYLREFGKIKKKTHLEQKSGVLLMKKTKVKKIMQVYV